VNTGKHGNLYLVFSDTDTVFRKIPGYDVSQYSRDNPKHADDVKMFKEEVSFNTQLGMEAHYKEGFAIRGWDGAIDQRDAMIVNNQATFHPTQYALGILRWLQTQPNFKCYTHTRIMGFQEKGVKILGMGSKSVKLDTESGHTISCKYAVQATCIPLQKLAVIAQEEYFRTYCIAVKIPKNYVEDCLIYDSADPYIYVRMTHCDDEHDYMVVGGCDHKVGQEDPAGRYEHLEQWVRQRFTKAGSVDYAWSGQINEPVDFMAYIGTNQGDDNIFIVTGDSGNGLTHGVIAGKLIVDQIEGKHNPWSKLYSPTRKMSMLKSLPDMLSHDLEINAQYKRFLQTDIEDVASLPKGEGGVLNKAGKGEAGPIAVYKDDEGEVHSMSALCPHLHGVVCWNNVEKSWDCPVHASRFSAKGLNIMGPAKGNLQPKSLKGTA
jgi:glycine/D-amino acid oxidase-like deaminating enzyme/nitrite reductase/ring-hydroxylating ferredoxin subunit